MGFVFFCCFFTLCNGATLITFLRHKQTGGANSTDGRSICKVKLGTLSLLSYLDPS